MSRQYRSDDTSQWIYKDGNGSDGLLHITSNTTFAAENKSISGSNSSAQKVLNIASAGFADGDLVLIVQSRGTNVGKKEYNRIASGGGTTALTMEFNLENTYADNGAANQAQIFKMYQYSGVIIDSGINWSAVDWNGDTGGWVCFFCNGHVTGPGTINLASKGYVGGLGRFILNGNGPAFTGEGTPAASFTSSSANGSGAGGGGVNSGNVGSSPGAGGGNATTGANGSGGDADYLHSNGGAAAGNTECTESNFGGGGGGGGVSDSGTKPFGNGGDGGGCLEMVCDSFSNLGINLDGGIGGSVGNDKLAVGGGGAAGTARIATRNGDFGTGQATANGGIGGTSTFGSHATGGTGSEGRFAVDYLGTITGTTSPAFNARQDTGLVRTIPAVMI